MTTTATTLRPIGAPGAEPRQLENFVMGDWVAGTGRMRSAYRETMLLNVFVNDQLMGMTAPN